MCYFLNTWTTLYILTDKVVLPKSLGQVHNARVCQESCFIRLVLDSKTSSCIELRQRIFIFSYHHKDRITCTSTCTQTRTLWRRNIFTSSNLHQTLPQTFDIVSTHPRSVFLIRINIKTKKTKTLHLPFLPLWNQGTLCLSNQDSIVTHKSNTATYWHHDI